MSEVTPLGQWLWSLRGSPIFKRLGVTSLDELDTKLREAGWATGEDVIYPLEKTYAEAIGDSDIARAQLLSLLRAAMHAAVRLLADENATTDVRTQAKGEDT